ncbi:hypothetical protein [Marinobacterium lutimaris]|uniref:Uncharacterized protein n=1 Tax=Marinobacterium lutimaris TaxID=568106 RepID=A0A1H5UHJ7_9GAMM|nr:hypothetical protein [Marinobacterium lutimaris]SEF73861.1 hypothetical protein SAMN05444390_101368 [Marinobacterium lutimaris]
MVCDVVPENINVDKTINENRLFTYDEKLDNINKGFNSFVLGFLIVVLIPYSVSLIDWQSNEYFYGNTIWAVALIDIMTVISIIFVITACFGMSRRRKILTIMGRSELENKKIINKLSEDTGWFLNDSNEKVHVLLSPPPWSAKFYDSKGEGKALVVIYNGNKIMISLMVFIKSNPGGSWEAVDLLNKQIKLYNKIESYL